MLDWNTQTELKDKQENFLKALFACRFSHLILFSNLTNNNYVTDFRINEYMHLISALEKGTLELYHLMKVRIVLRLWMDGFKLVFSSWVKNISKNVNYIRASGWLQSPLINMNKMILLIYFAPAAAVGEDDSLIMSAQCRAVSLH